MIRKPADMLQRDASMNGNSNGTMSTFAEQSLLAKEANRIISMRLGLNGPFDSKEAFEDAINEKYAEIMLAFSKRHPMSLDEAWKKHRAQMKSAYNLILALEQLVLQSWHPLGYYRDHPEMPSMKAPDDAQILFAELSFKILKEFYGFPEEAFDAPSETKEALNVYYHDIVEKWSKEYMIDLKTVETQLPSFLVKIVTQVNKILLELLQGTGMEAQIAKLEAAKKEGVKPKVDTTVILS